MTACGAKTRSGGQCQQPAGWGTQHVGQGRCKLHGGNAGAPIITGRYSIKRQALAAKAQAFYADPTPGDLTAELVLMRALLQEYLDRFEDEKTRLPFDDIQRIFGMVEAIGRLVERIAKILATTALTQNEVQQFKQAFLAELPNYVPESDKRVEFIAAIAAALGFAVGDTPGGYIDVEAAR